MPKEFHRSERVAELIHRIISDIVRNELRDPRLRLVTVTDLKLSRDLTVAKIYFTSMDDSVDLDEVAEVLGKASGFIRKRVGGEVRLRQTPELRFLKDVAELHGRQVSKLIAGAVSSDAAKAAAREQGTAAPSAASNPAPDGTSATGPQPDGIKREDEPSS